MATLTNNLIVFASTATGQDFSNPALVSTDKFSTGGLIRATDMNQLFKETSLITNAFIDIIKGSYDLAENFEISKTTPLGTLQTSGAVKVINNALSNYIKGVTVNNAVNVTTSINNKSISSIFETNGTTVKNATTASKLGSVTIGSGTRPIYLSNGAAAAIDDPFTSAPQTDSQKIYVATRNAGSSSTTFDWNTSLPTGLLPVASSSALGGIKIGYSTSGKNYAVQLSSNKAYVNVPWENTWRNVKVNGTEKLGTAVTTGSLDFATGTTNGTISVASTEVAVKGLGSAAYTNSTAYDVAGAAASAVSNRVIANSAITGATKCKITYDSKGLVTAGTNLAASDIPSLDTSKITSGTFADARIASAATWNAKQNALSAGSNIILDGTIISAIDTTYSAGTGISIMAGNTIIATGVEYSDSTVTPATSPELRFIKCTQAQYDALSTKDANTFYIIVG